MQVLLISYNHYNQIVEEMFWKICRFQLMIYFHYILAVSCFKQPICWVNSEEFDLKIDYNNLDVLLLLLYNALLYVFGKT